MLRALRRGGQPFRCNPWERLAPTGCATPYPVAMNLAALEVNLN
jgi:hypothetical protein